MAQSTVLAAGTAGGTSTDITVAAGAKVKIGIFPGAGTTLPADVRATLISDTPGNPISHFTFDKSFPAMLVEGPGTFNVVIPQTATAVGAFWEN